MNYILIFILGLLFGSFFNVCIYRIPREESIAFPPSHCTNCGNKLKPIDLIPVISYLFLKKKCRYCGEKISLRYPMIELFTALTWLIIYVIYGYSIITIKYIFLFSCILVIGIIDYDTQEVYFSTSLVGIMGGSIFIIVEAFMYKTTVTPYGYILKDYILGGIIPAAIIAIIAFATKGMGWGDVEIMFMCGLFFGIKESLLLMLLSFIVGGVIGTILLITKKKGRKDTVAFVPFIAVASVIVMLWGENLIKWYFS
ncbi:prepilin peptidase [Haloimpatiens massiliensis]|uniref:prepilin peptidase n=1 Tax=Haloimpatiens massiliensis TaxID=1658110 RepID=UPI000C827981|nr:A24 family peptidase [Haloimpatiens massiliensis]